MSSARGTSGDDQAVAALRSDFQLCDSELFLGRSVCTNERAAPGVLSITTGFVCFKPGQAGAPGTAATNPRHDAASASGAASGQVKISISDLSLAERTKKWRKEAGKSRGYSIMLVDKQSCRYTFHGVLHCELVLTLLAQVSAHLACPCVTAVPPTCVLLPSHTISSVTASHHLWPRRR